MRELGIRVTFSLALMVVAATAAEEDADVEARTGIAGCEVIRPNGDCALVVLELTVPGDPEHGDRDRRKPWTWTSVGSLRGGRMRVDDGVGLREPGGWLELKDGRLTGRFRRVALSAEVTIDATVADGTVTGTATVGGRTATVSGRYVPEADLARRNEVSKDASWPAAQGPLMGGCSAEWTGAATIDDPAGLRMVWRSEESDIGRAMGNITRFMHTWKDASTRRTGSGCASPVVADGKVFFKYYVPAPREAGQPEMKHPNYGLTEAQGIAKLLKEAREAGYTGETLPEYAAEKVYQNVDDVVLCMDVATGKTLWKAVVRKRPTEGERHYNSQHHKAGPFDMSPAYGDGRVFALGMTGRLYAFDAATGEPLWEVKSDLDYSNALIAIGDVVVAPAGREWGGYDAATGALQWTAGGGRAMSTLSAWSHGGKHYLIGVMGPSHARTGVDCLDAATGKHVWNLPINVLTSGRGLGPGGISVFGDRMLVNQDNGTGKKGDPIKPAVAAYRLTPARAELLWQLGPDADTARVEALRGKNAHLGPVHPECVPVVVRGKYVFTADLRVVDLATGKVLATATGLAPMNGGYMQAVEDLVLVRRDGTHGNMECGFYKVAADGGVRALTGEGAWIPPVGGTTTSYHHPIFYPMADGRMFFRQENGIYCWDIRRRGSE
jgi:outer membrane protein assembly factor BamB